MVREGQGDASGERARNHPHPCHQETTAGGSEVGSLGLSASARLRLTAADRVGLEKSHRDRDGSTALGPMAQCAWRKCARDGVSASGEEPELERDGLA
jgi:hypothetical protein